MNGTHETQRNGRHHPAPAAVAKVSRPMTPTMALIWRQWRETRALIGALLAFAAAFALGLAANQMTPYRFEGEGLKHVQLMGYACMVAMLGLGLGVGGLNARSQGVLFAPHWLTLPISTVRMAAVLLGYRLFILAAWVAAALTMAWIISHSSGLDAIRWTGEILELHSLAIIACAGLMFFGCSTLFIWLILPIHLMLAWAVAAALYGGLFHTIDVVGPTNYPGLTTVLQPVATLSIGLLTLAAAPWGLVAQRQGRWAGVNGWRPELWSANRSRPFASPDEALRWYEWRVAAWFLPWWGVPLVLVAAILNLLYPYALYSSVRLLFAAITISPSVPSDERVQVHSEIAFGAVSPVLGTVVSSAALGVLVAVSAGSAAMGGIIHFASTPPGWKHFTMPASNRRMARASFVVAAKGAIAVGVSILVALAFVYLVGEEKPSLRLLGYFALIAGVTTPLLLWATYHVGWQGYFALMVFWVIWKLPEAFAFYSYADPVADSASGGVWNFATFALTMFALLIFATAAFGSQKGYLSAGTLGRAAAISPLFIAAAFIPAMFGNETYYPSKAVLAICAGLALFFLFPLFYVPTFIGWRRTR